MRPRRHVTRLLLLAAATALAVPAFAGDDGPRPAERPTSQAQLTTRALAALASGNVDGYVALLPTVDDMKRYCPKEYERQGKTPEKLAKELERMHAKVAKRVTACRELFDWARARQVGVEGGAVRRKVAACDAVEELEDIDVFYELDGQRYRVRLDDPFVLDGKIYGLSDDPRCAADAPAPDPAPPGPQPPPPGP